ncbi:MAG: hypothetical protein ACRC9V_15575, partial [Aeromonas sp.]
FFIAYGHLLGDDHPISSPPLTLIRREPNKHQASDGWPDVFAYSSTDCPAYFSFLCQLFISAFYFSFLFQIRKSRH